MGRFSLLLVLGFSFTLLFIGPNAHRQGNRAYENYLSYLTKSMVHNIAASGANLGANQLFFDTSWTAGYSNVSIGAGTCDVTLSNVAGTNQKKLTSIGHYQKGMQGGGVLATLNDTVEVLLQPSSFAKFGVYLNNMSGVAWFTGDTVWGPCHVEGTMNVLGKPVFYGKVTTKNGTNPASLPSGSTAPKFYGGYQSGVSVPMPTSFAQLQSEATAGGKVFTPPGSPSGTYEVRLVLNADGTVTYKEYKGATQVGTTPSVTVALTSLAPNGVILINGGNLRVHGTLNGRATIGALGSTSAIGNVYIDGDVLLKQDPRTNPASTDMLGIVADNNVQIPLPIGFPTTPAPTNVAVQSSIFCRTGSFTAELNSSMGVKGSVNVLGSLVSNTIGAFGATDGSGVLTYGYSNNFRFDDRLLVSAPPKYPNTSLFEVLSWKE